MRLVFYSGGSFWDNRELDLHVLRIVGKRYPSFTFIPANFEDSHDDFEEFTKSFSRFGVSDFLLFPVDKPFSSLQLGKALKRDFIFLSGGNTFYFLRHLKRSGVFRSLQLYGRAGGIIGGVSAGAIIQTPTINTAAFPGFDCDENFVNLKNWNSLGLTNFEFFPHYLNSQAYITSLLDYSLTSKWPIYACPNGSGLILEDNKIQFVGRTWIYFKGERFRLL